MVEKQAEEGHSGTAAVNLSPELFHGHTRATLQLRQTIDPGEIPTQVRISSILASSQLDKCFATVPKPMRRGSPGSERRPACYSYDAYPDKYVRAVLT